MNCMVDRLRIGSRMIRHLQIMFSKYLRILLLPLLRDHLFPIIDFRHLTPHSLHHHHHLPSLTAVEEQGPALRVLIILYLLHLLELPLVSRKVPLLIKS